MVAIGKQAWLALMNRKSPTALRWSPVQTIVGASHRHGGPVTTRRDQEARPAPDLVDRKFSASGPNQLWVADITYVPTASGFLYLAVVLDAWSRKIVGWSMANHLWTELVLDAMEAAVGQRRPKDVIHHSDQGSQPEFNRSSQRPCGLTGDARQMPRQASSIQGSSAAWCREPALLPGEHSYCERLESIQDHVVF